MHTNLLQRSHPDITTTGSTVVAVDGSPESRAAMQWAADHARLTGTSLQVVTAYLHPAAEVEGEAGFPPAHDDVYAVAAGESALAVVESVIGHRDVDHVVAQGPIEAVLVGHAQGASTIVIGTRDRAFWQRFRPSLTDRVTGRVDGTVISVPHD